VAQPRGSKEQRRLRSDVPVEAAAAGVPYVLASGFSPIYPCDVLAREIRSRPIGIGPFKFVEFKPNEHIKVTRNPDCWKPGRPYLDGIEYTIIKNASTAILVFAAGKFDMTFPYTITQPLLNDVKDRLPQASCEMSALGLYRSLIVNREQLTYGAIARRPQRWLRSGSGLRPPSCRRGRNGAHSNECTHSRLDVPGH
jgi:hypothetical protein